MVKQPRAQGLHKPITAGGMEDSPRPPMVWMLGQISVPQEVRSPSVCHRSPGLRTCVSRQRQKEHSSLEGRYRTFPHSSLSQTLPVFGADLPLALRRPQHGPERYASVPFFSRKVKRQESSHPDVLGIKIWLLVLRASLAVSSVLHPPYTSPCLRAFAHKAP